MSVFSEIVALDKALFLMLNRLHHPWLDGLMWQVSGHYLWLPLYVFVLWCMVRAANWRVLPWVALLIAASDQISGLIKDSVGRFRPWGHADLVQFVHFVNDYHGGRYGFVSSHAANTFAFAMFVSLFFGKRWVALMTFAWAVLVSYSRIYLGVHFPLDIIGGAVLGGFLGWVFYVVWQRWVRA